ncbi:MAG TPA: Flp family type IVb pilin [Frankiaceae bacterium]|nr:Flp family type IVb pilin [Frankiaceae bacterium]
MLQYVRQSIQARREEGASAVEYGLLVAAIAALIVVIVFALGGIVKDVFKSTCDEIKTKGTTITTDEDCSDQ